MDISEDNIICRLCLEKSTENYESIEEIARHALNYLTLYPNLTINDDPMMCESCAGNLTKCFDFKRRCLSIEDCVSSFAEGEDKKVDLRIIYSKLKQVGSIDTVSDNHSVCRFCLELTKDDASMSVKDDMDVIEILQKYFLEMDLKITEDIIACTPCYKYLQFYVSFINNYMNVEQRIDEYCKSEGLNYKGQVDLRDVETFISKSLLNVEDVSSLVVKEEVVDAKVEVKVKFEDIMNVEQEEKLVDKEVQQEDSNSFQHYSSPSQSDGEPQTTTAKSAEYTCEICGYQNNCRDLLQEHILTHKGTDLVANYNCEICPFKTKKKEYLRRHMLRRKHKHTDAVHANTDMVTRGTIHKCDLCHYETKRKFNLKSHMLIHKTPAEVIMYDCELCDYKTKRVADLMRHTLTHKPHSEITMYKCEMCDYEAVQNANLKKHMLTHETPSDITMYKCETCAYTTKRKDHLQEHVLVHMEASKIMMYKCKMCPYVSKWNKNLQKHLTTHNTSDEVTKVTIYKCDLCDYETKWKSHLKRHIPTHKTSSDINMYKCEKCDCEYNYISCLRRHMLVHIQSHKTPSGITMFKCDLCDYEAKQESDLKGHILTHSEITIVKHEVLDEVDEVQYEDK